MTTDDDVRAYNERRTYLKERGVSTPDLYGQDEYDDESDPTGNLRHYQRINAEAEAFARDGTPKEDRPGWW